MTAALNFKKRYLKRTELVNGDPHVYILFVFLSEQQPRIVADTSVSPFARVLNILPRTQILCPGHKKCFRFCSETFLCPQQMFPSLCSPRNIMGNNVSAKMCPRLPVPL